MKRNSKEFVHLRLTIIFLLAMEQKKGLNKRTQIVDIGDVIRHEKEPASRL